MSEALSLPKSLPLSPTQYPTGDTEPCVRGHRAMCRFQGLSSCHPLYPRNPARPLFETLTKSDLDASWAVGAAEVPGGALSSPLHPPTSLVALRQLYGGQIEAVSLLAGLFLHLSNPALIFSTLAFPPPLAPWQASPASPSSVSQARQRATGLPGD